MKKVLFIVTKSENGGAQKWTKEQIDICSNDFECFLATDKNGWLTQNVIVNECLLDELIHKRFSFKYFIKLSKFIKKNNIDLIIASSANAGIYSRLIKILNPTVKVIYVSHGWSSIYNGGNLKFIYTFIEKILSILSDSILTISKKDYDNAMHIIGINQKKLKLITNKIYPMKNQKKSLNKKIKLLTVSRLVPPKRVDLLIKAVKDIDAELHIIGNGILKTKLELMTKNKNVYFHGEIDDFNDFSSYDIFILISDSEGLPLSALEAMSVGLPLILSNVGGCFELIENNGILVKNNIQEIKNAIIKCINNQEIFSQNSKIIFNKKFNLEKNKYQYIKYYKDILFKL